MRQVFRVARFRFRATLGQRWAGYLGLVILLGLMGGVAMGAVSAGRRTRSAFPAFLASTNPSDVNIEYSGPGNSYSRAFTAAAARLPHVRGVKSFVVLDAGILNPDGTARTGPTRIAIAGSVDGDLFDQDRFSVTKGRMANPERADEVVVSELAADTLGLHVGQTLPIGILTFDAPTPVTGHPPELHQRVDATIVGIGKLNGEVVEDDVGRFPTYIVATPALTRSLLDCCIAWTWMGFQLEHGRADVPAVEREYIATLGPNIGYQFRPTAQVEDQAQRAIAPEAVALGAFGVITAAAGLVIAVQAIGRQLRTERGDHDILRALGADPNMTTIDGVLGIVGAIVLGLFVAAGVAIALSPLAPIGPVRAVDPSPGVALDWTVLGVGAAVLLVGLTAVALGLAYRNAPHRLARRSRPRPSAGARAAALAGLPAPAIVGVGFALETGHGRNSVPVRSAIAGTALGVVIVIAAVTFASSLASLISHPALYGWNWSYALESTDGYGPIPPQGQTMLDHDPNVAAWTGVYFATVDIDGQAVPAIFGSTHAEPASPILTGHAFDTPDQLVLGAATLRQLHKRLGDVVSVSHGSATSGDLTTKQLRIVGTATMPAVGTLDGLHSSMGTGALLSEELIPAAGRNQFGPLSGPNMIFVRMRSGSDGDAAVRSLQATADSVNAIMAADPNLGLSAEVFVLPVQHPAEIVNYRSMGATPAVLATGLAAGAVIALGVTLTASVRRRRRDLAVLKTLGFTHRQLAAVVACQASTAAAIGLVIGIPLGIVLGRWLWILFARQIFAVPQPIVPVLSVVLVAAGAFVLANAMAAFPGRAAARTQTALLLRAE